MFGFKALFHYLYDGAKGQNVGATLARLLKKRKEARLSLAHNITFFNSIKIRKITIDSKPETLFVIIINKQQTSHKVWRQRKETLSLYKLNNIAYEQF